MAKWYTQNKWDVSKKNKCASTLNFIDMKSNILTKYQKSNYNSDYFGTGNTKNAKSRWRRYLKKVAKRLFNKDMNKD